MRALLRVLATLLIAAVAGCGDGGGSRALDLPPGRACLAVELDTVESILGVRFEERASAQVAETYSCVLTLTDASLPDLTFTMSATTADEVIFTTTVTPSFATALTELGRIAYQVSVPPGTAADDTPTGPGLEVGWLSAAPRLMLLRYTWPVGATDADVTAFAPRLLELAKQIEQAVHTGPTLS